MPSLGGFTKVNRLPLISIPQIPFAHRPYSSYLNLRSLSPSWKMTVDHTAFQITRERCGGLGVWNELCVFIVLDSCSSSTIIIRMVAPKIASILISLSELLAATVVSQACLFTQPTTANLLFSWSWQPQVRQTSLWHSARGKISIAVNAAVSP